MCQLVYHIYQPLAFEVILANDYRSTINPKKTTLMHKYGGQIFWQAESHFTRLACETVPCDHMKTSSIWLLYIKYETTVVPSPCLFVYGLLHLEKLTGDTHETGQSTVVLNPLAPASFHLVTQEVLQWSRTGHVQVTYVQGLKKTEKKDKYRLFIDEVIVVKTSRWLWPAVSETVNWQTGRNNESCHNGTRWEGIKTPLPVILCTGENWAVIITDLPFLINKGKREKGQEYCVCMALLKCSSRFDLWGSKKLAQNGLQEIKQQVRFFNIFIHFAYNFTKEKWNLFVALRF